MKEVAIEVKNVSISYRNIKKVSIHQNLFRKRTEKKNNDFVAVKNVSFDVTKGEILGVIGKNGSGKSTLLRSLAGIFQPDTGVINTKNYRVALMAIGVGFKPDISGRENIVLSGMLLGFDEEYIRDRLEDIIEFSELGEFIDKPVRTYSSGMYSKLTFATTALMDADIILIDEVLSVGDEKFKKKSFNKMKELILNRDKTVVIVSHDIGTLRELTDRVLWLHDGEIKMIDETNKVLDMYQEFMK